jgi:transcriptional regulator with PAS, ATPase and Fis domain
MLLKSDSKDALYRSAIVRTEAFTLGRGEDLSFPILDPRVSHIQATIRRVAGDLYTIEPSTTEAPTFVDGERITKPVRLEDGSHIVIGSVEISAFSEAFFKRDTDLTPDTARRLARSPTSRPRSLIHESAAMKSLVRDMLGLANGEEPCLILGETGTGKELVAREIHDVSERRHKPFVVVNAPAVPENIFEAELFGTVPGAFSGAIDRKGWVEAAGGGTLFFDEIGDLRLEAQAKLLRLIESGEVQRLGSTKTTHVDVRILAATNRDLNKKIAERTFRDDLYFRFDEPLRMPRLADREGDVRLLANWFLSQKSGGKCKFDEEAVVALERHTWPGNVRELRRVVSGALRHATGATITAAEVAPLLFAPVAAASDGCFEKAISIEEATRRAIKTALRETNGNKAQAAKILGCSRETLSRPPWV